MKKKVQAKPAASNMAAPVVDSAREIWLAGLGAFSFAQEESGKIIDQGNKLFEKLVAEGAKLEKKTRDVAESAVGDINLVGSLIEMGTEVDAREDGFYKTALHRAVISGHKDVAELLLAKGWCGS